jgi:hypothetical protein
LERRGLAIVGVVTGIFKRDHAPVDTNTPKATPL